MLACASMLAACATIGPESMQRSRLEYNETLKASTDEQLLLNIVRLRYTDSPTSLAVGSVAAQFERSLNYGLMPFFTAAGGDNNRSFTSVLPQFGYGSAERPTFSLNPLDDQEFARRFFTPLSADAIVKLARATWPISTVFRLYLENLNWVSNAETASGPTPATPPEFSRFRQGIDAMQRLQDSGQLVLTSEDSFEPLGPSRPAAAITTSEVLEAAKAGLEFQQDPEQPNRLQLSRKKTRTVMHLKPAIIDAADARTLREVFHLAAGRTRYPISEGALTPFGGQGRDAPAESSPDSKSSGEKVATLDFETRSLLQSLYFVSHGVDVPAAHLRDGIALQTLDGAGRPFDWSTITSGLFRVHSSPIGERPRRARVAVPYRGHWFYIDESDQSSKATFALLVEVSRLEMNSSGRADSAPVLTLPVGGR